MGWHAFLQGIFLIQRLNLGLLHGRQILYHLSHQGSPLTRMSLSNSSYSPSYLFLVYQPFNKYLPSPTSQAWWAWFVPWMPPVLTALLLKVTVKSKPSPQAQFSRSCWEGMLTFHVQDTRLPFRQLDAGHRTLPLTALSLLTWNPGNFPHLLL